MAWVAWGAVGPPWLSVGGSRSRGGHFCPMWVARSGWWASPGDSRPVGARGETCRETGPPGAHGALCRRGPASLQYPPREHPGRGGAGGGVLQDEERESPPRPRPWSWSVPGPVKQRAHPACRVGQDPWGFSQSQLWVEAVGPPILMDLPQVRLCWPSGHWQTAWGPLLCLYSPDTVGTMGVGDSA